MTRASEMSTAPAPRDLRRTSRILAAIVLPIGPAAVALLRYVLPYDTTSSTTDLVAKIAAHPGTESLVVWLGTIAVFTLIPGVLAAGRLLRPHAPRLTLAAVVLAMSGYLALPILLGTETSVLIGLRKGIDPATLATLIGSAHPTQNIAAGVFVVGHVVGTVLLGIAMWRSRMVPKWGAVVTAISQPLHFIAAVILANHLLDLFAWGMTAAGMTCIAVAILRLPNDEWDVPPACDLPRGLSSQRG